MKDVATIRDFLNLLNRLKVAHIHYILAAPTEGALMVQVAVPGQRWEIEMHEDRRVSVEVFVSERGVQGAERLEELFGRFSD